MNKLLTILIFCLVTKSFLAGATGVDGTETVCDVASQAFFANLASLYQMELDMFLRGKETKLLLKSLMVLINHLKLLKMRQKQRINQNLKNKKKLGKTALKE